MELNFSDEEDDSVLGNDTPDQPLSIENNAQVRAEGGAFAAAVPFSALCELFERSSKSSKSIHKQKLFQTFLSHYHDDDYFPLMRLLLPQLDKERQSYGMKETVLGKLYVEILGISPTSEDAQRLIHWRKPGKGSNIAQDKIQAGDFGTAVYMTLKSRCAAKGDMSLAEINQCLDELNAITERKDRVRILKKMLRRTTANEQKWIVRIILKELKMGMSEKSILTYFHPDALQLFNISSSLRTVCQELKSPSIRLASNVGDNISLFNPIKPMLASRHAPENVVKVMDGSPFVIEQKFDGERVQLHKNGKDIRLFSRNSNNVTDIYGEKLMPMIQNHILVSRCILDGELVVWDSIAEKFEEFGKLKSLANFGRNNDESQDIRSSSTTKAGVGSNIGKQLCYIVFDLLYVNDRSVMDLTLQQRMILLKRCIKTKPKVVEIVEQREARTATDIIEALDNAIMNNEEGIMIKNLNSTYTPSERKNKWLKLKPEYIDGIGDDLDLLILGGYYGSGVGKRAGTISHFLLGVAVYDENDVKTDVTGDRIPKNFYSFCKVGTGYSLEELNELQKLLEPHWHVFKPGNPPTCFQLAEPLKEKPDVWIHPKNSRILQVKAAQIVPTEKYKVGYTLRFPRAMKIRMDKEWKDCMTMQEVTDLASQFGGRYARRTYGDISQGDHTNGKKKKVIQTAPRKTHNLLAAFRGVDTSTITVTTKTFTGIEFCIMNGDGEHTKQALETLVAQNNGSIAQNPTSSTHYVIAAKKVLKVQNLIQRGEFDIVHYQWLLDSVEMRTLLPLEPKYMMYTTPATKNVFLLENDRYGDSYTVDATLKSIQDAFKQIDREAVEEQERIRVKAEIRAIKPESPKKIKNERVTKKIVKKEESEDEIEDSHAAEIFSLVGQPSSKRCKYIVETDDDVVAFEKHFFSNSDSGSSQISASDQNCWWGKFRDYCIYLDYYQAINSPESGRIENSSLDVVCYILRFYGASITDTINKNTTHIVLDQSDLTRFYDIRNQVKKLSRPIHMVRKEWVEESANLHEDLDEAGFYVNKQLLGQPQ